jgi:hypothetical protein
MSIEITESTIGVWFLTLDRKTDFLAALETVPEGFKLSYRFRYYGAIEDPWLGNDKKNWYSGIFKGTKEAALNTMRAVVEGLEERSGRTCTELLMTNGLDAFMKEFAAQPWAHFKVEH